MELLKKEFQPLEIEMKNIRQMVKILLPGIDSMSNLEKIKQLRNLVYNQVAIGNNAVPYKYSMDPDLFVRLYLKDNYTALCGDIALVYHYMLMAYDIPSNIVGLFYNLTPPIDNHVSVQVYSEEYGKFIISDPSFNMFVVDSASGTPMNYIGFKNAIKNKKNYLYDYNGFDLVESRKVSSYYIDYWKLTNYIYVDLWLSWDGSFIYANGSKGNYLYEWRGMNHYSRDRVALFEGR